MNHRAYGRTDPEPDDPCTGSDGMKGDILFENVSFSYENQPVLKNLAFTAPEKNSSPRRSKRGR